MSKMEEQAGTVNNIYDLLKGPIDKSRQHYKQRLGTEAVESMPGVLRYTVDRTAPYGLTGAIFSDDRQAVIEAEDKLRYAAGNLYLNDKPTGAVVAQQPFGGSRASGTNDKAGSMWNLIRWVTPRTVKETFVPATDYRYPHMG